MTRASPKPFAPPSGSSSQLPASAAGSVRGRPSRSSISPGGRACPAWAGATFELAVALVAMSSTTGGWRPAGSA